MVEGLKANWRGVELAAENHAMLVYVEKLTKTPWEMIEKDVIALREAGFSDSAILDINQVCAYYAYVNRLADGLGVEIEEAFQQESAEASTAAWQAAY